MKILVDMNLSPGWVTFLASAGHDVVHWSGVGRGDEADDELMVWAVKHGYLIVTADLDFDAILAASSGNGPSVVQIRSDNLTIDSIGPAVIRALQQAEQELLTGALVSLDTTRARLRILPLKSPPNPGVN